MIPSAHSEVVRAGLAVRRTSQASFPGPLGRTGGGSGELLMRVFFLLTLYAVLFSILTMDPPLDPTAPDPRVPPTRTVPISIELEAEETDERFPCTDSYICGEGECWKGFCAESGYCEAFRTCV